MELAVGALLILLGFLIKTAALRYFGSYADEKGKNLATKEDVEAITDKVETIKAELSGRLTTHGFRYQKEFEILEEIASRLFDLASAAAGLRPVLDFVDPNVSDAERDNARLKVFSEARYALHIYREHKRPFYPERIHEMLQQIDKIAHREATQFRMYTTHGAAAFEGTGISYWEQQEKNISELTASLSEAREAIRGRVREFDLVAVGSVGTS